MFRSLFLRLLTVYLAVVLALLASLTLIFASIYQSEYYADRVEALTSQAQELAALSATSMRSFAPASNNMLAQAYYYAASRYDAVVWLVDKTGVITAVRVDDQNKPQSGALEKTQEDTAQDGTAAQEEKPGAGTASGDRSDPSMTAQEFEQYFSKVVQGETVTERGVFGGRFSREVLTVGVPVQYGDGVVGAIFLHSRLETVQSELLGIYRRFGVAALALVIVGAALVFWVSRLVTKPLTQMNRAVDELAKGNFDKRVEARGHDEVGQLAQSFNTMAEELQRQEELRRGFVANVSHELRSPMTSVQGFAQGMLDGTIPEAEHPKYLDVIVSETRRLNKLIRELLDLAQIESGKFPLNKQVFDINESLRRALIRFEARIDAKNADVDVDFNQDKAMVLADQDRIDQVITNLIDNAVKFLPEKGGCLSIWTHTADDKILVGIKDNGVGIPEEDQEYIWERFYKVDKSHTGKKGTGLGLSIVKRILDQHGERITLQSRPGAGCAFVFSLTPAKD
ncbi:MAG: ATP-binding protein [Eubacteriales bacterium]|nr:ATP-binding protein [Eubacteriales bacterium]